MEGIILTMTDMRIIRNAFTIITSAALLTLSFSSCSIFKPSDKSDGSGKGMTGWVQSNGDVSDKSSSVLNNKTKKGSGRVKKSTDKVVADAEKEVKETLVKSSDVSLDGDWAIETVFGKKAVGETVPFIKFATDEKRIYGNNGCNVMNANYVSNSDAKTIAFENLATTMMLCAGSNLTDTDICQALGMTSSFSIEENESDKILTFYDSDKRVVMTLMHRDFHFLDGTWAVVAIDGEEVNVPDMKLALDVDEKHLHGNTGCNIINGELETDMDTPNSISFSKIAMTRMACPDSGWETRMTMALEEAVTAKRAGKDEIELIGSNGQQVMLLKRTSPIAE